MAAAVEHGFGVVGDAQAREQPLQLRNGRQGEAEAGGSVGRIANEIEKQRAGDVPLVESREPRLGPVAALRRRAKKYRGVQDAPAVHVFGQFGG